MVAAQLTLNALVAASILFPLALGFALVYRVGGFIHFAHGLVYAAGAYGAYLSFGVLHWPLAGCLLGAIIAASCVGMAIELVCYRPLRFRGAPPLVLLLASLGVFALGENILALAFGDGARSIKGYRVSEGIEFLGAVVTQGQIAAIVSACVAGTLFFLILELTPLGNRLEACAQSRRLAIACGIDAEAYLLISVLMASILAGSSAFFTVLATDIVPTMGLSPLMYAIVVAMIGGNGRVGRVAGGAILLAACQTAASWFFGSRWEEAVAFGVLASFMFVRGSISRWRSPMGMAIEGHG